MRCDDILAMTSGCAETHTPLADDLLLMNINYVKADNSPQDFSRYVSTNVLKADALSGHTLRGGRLRIGGSTCRHLSLSPFRDRRMINAPTGGTWSGCE